MEGRTKRIVTIQKRCLPYSRETPHIRVGTNNRRMVPGRRRKSRSGTPLLLLVEPGRVNRKRRNELDTKDTAPDQPYIVSIA